MPSIDEQIDGSDTLPFLPDITVVDRDLELPETWSFGAGYERRLGRGLTAEFAYQHARTDELFRFVDRNHPAFGSPFGVGTPPRRRRHQRPEQHGEFGTLALPRAHPRPSAAGTPSTVF